MALTTAGRRVSDRLLRLSVGESSRGPLGAQPGVLPRRRRDVRRPARQRWSSRGAQALASCAGWRSQRTQNSGGRSTDFLAAAFEADGQPLAKPHLVCATEAITDERQRKQEGKER